MLLVYCYILSSKTQASPPEMPTSTKSFHRQIPSSCSLFLSCLYQSRLLCCINKHSQNLSDLQPWLTVMTSSSNFPVSFWTKTHGSYSLYYKGFQIFQPWSIGKSVFYFTIQLHETTVVMCISLWCISHSPFYCSVLFFFFKDLSPNELISWCTYESSHLAPCKHPSCLTDILQWSWYRTTCETCAEHLMLFSPCCNL